MRALICVGLMLAGVARAAPLDLVTESRGASAPQRAQAAKQLAARTAADPDAALVAVLSNDPVVRATLIDALVDANAFSRPAAAHIPTLRTLERQLAALVRPAADRDFAMPQATSCHVTSADARGATIDCRGSRCAGSCIHVTTDVTLRAGVRWTVVRQTSRGTDDGVCGCCMTAE